ncbi:hypothetical protein MWU60_18795 [Yoonia sp. F2084L]|uniref:hypothetical protein n=1 Tax=Yoonia sp. F2084L TaxID=2926419 RepID=UPI001FF4C9D3|nr:hypothetical protein [Yoonia sp. F2084L]MCK0097629.1 hypothetical protein [Yoonia sp. F2084L]
MTQTRSLVRGVVSVYTKNKMRGFIALFTRFFVVIALAFAMAGSSFAHRIAPSDIDESLLAYVAAGGVLDDLCGADGYGAGNGETCDACRLVDSAVAPTAVATTPSDVDTSLLQTRKRVSVNPLIDVSNPSCPVRAPPFV